MMRRREFECEGERKECKIDEDESLEKYYNYYQNYISPALYYILHTK